MKAVVALKDSASVSDSFEIENGSIPERFLDYELNEWDAYALEEAVRLHEDDLVDEVVTVTMGPERSEEAIRRGLAKGADRAIRVWDQTLASWGYLDCLTKAYVLHAVIDREEPDLVLTGVQSADDMFGATGVALAARLGYAWAAVVVDLEVDEDRISVRRELEGGTEELVDLTIPAVCTVQTGINEPRYASLRGIRMAQRADIETLTLDDLDLSTASLARDVGLSEMVKPVSETTAEIYDGSPAEKAERLAAFLRDNGVGS